MSGALIISAHDFRSRRQASVHFIAAGLAERCRVRFASIGLSDLSLRRGDVREHLVSRAGRVEFHQGVECFLWKSRLHPFHVRRRGLAWMEPLIFAAYGLAFPRLLRRWISEAETILLESGIAAAYAGVVHAINPRARLVYLASDDLEVIGAAPTVRRRFERDYNLFDLVRLPSRLLAGSMPHLLNAAFIPQGLDRSVLDRAHEDPYGGRPACVSVGSMLFDRSFFDLAAPAFPDLDFYVIGAGPAAAGLAGPNIHVLSEMRFDDTLAYLRHARFGVAPYRDAGAPAYLIDTSLKLRQFAMFGLPSVCPVFACGGMAHRHGYVPGDRSSIVRAVAAALGHAEPVEEPSLAWSQVVDRIVDPGVYPDTEMKSWRA